MPIYEYKCQKCGNQFEVFQGISDPEVKSCKFCKGKVQKIVIERFTASNNFPGLHAKLEYQTD